MADGQKGSVESAPDGKEAQKEKVGKEPPRAEAQERPKESGGRGGLEPTRYGDWEVNGLASDF